MPYAFKQFLEKIASEKAPGPSKTFSIFHILQAIELISKEPIGRNKLAEKLDVGEGAIRTIITRLKDADLISTSKAGCFLTKKGLRVLKEYKAVFEKRIRMEKNELTIGEYGSAILVKNCAKRVKSGVEQRDAAVMSGAKGATTIIFQKGRLTIPSVSNNVANDFPKAAKQILTQLQPEENDVIIVGSADTLEKADYGTLAAAWTLLND